MHTYEFYLAKSPNAIAIGDFLHKGIHVVMLLSPQSVSTTNPIEFEYHLKLIKVDPPIIGFDTNGQMITYDLTAYFCKIDNPGSGVPMKEIVPNIFNLKFPNSDSDIDFAKNVGHLKIIVQDSNNQVLAEHTITRNGGNGDPDDLIFPSMPVEFPIGPVI